MIGEHLQVLFLKCSLAMVLQLAVDICRHCIHFGGTYRERAVAVLPMKLQTRALFFIDVFAGVRLICLTKSATAILAGMRRSR